MFIEAPIYSCIRCALPRQYCVCLKSPFIELIKPCHILFHPREMTRRNSTGRLLKMCSNIETSLWHRLQNKQMENQFQGYYLLYPNKDTSFIQPPATQARGFLWLDGTWQETQKMLRQSPWLNTLPKFSLQAQKSQYRLRRNQTQTGLSTLESVSYWLKEQNEVQSSQELLNFFNEFQTTYLCAQQAGQLK